MARTRGTSTGEQNINKTPGDNDKKQGPVTYYKARHQASVIWDKTKDKAMIEFDKNLTFTTDDPKLIAVLDKMGYKTEPPVIMAGETSGFVPSDKVGGEQIEEQNDDQEI